ncbi:MAG: carboxylesterase/lipase family protein [Steroidobacteraceae bacterium]
MTAPSIHARSIAGAPTLVEAPAGALKGRSHEGVEAFVGIPYAAPPVGSLRWREPQQAARWQGVRQAAAFGRDCPQQRLPYDATPSTHDMSEDCLTLNLWRPARAERLPVMIWIHGGGFVMGSSASPVLDGAALARRGVVLVSCNYRLGRFGFFAHPALSAGSRGPIAANFALLDMIAVLQWVRANIAAFGGDPGNVTLFGESSGGAAVNFLMGAPGAHGLYHKAIVQSGANREPYARLATDRPGRISAERAGSAFAQHAGLASADAQQLRALPTDVVQGGQSLMDQQADRFTGPVVDGVTVLADPIDSFTSAAVAAVPYLIGSTSAELSEESFAPLMMNLIRSQVSADSMADLERVYGTPPDNALIDDYFFTEAARGFARIMSQRDAPTWRYVFDHVAESQRAARRGANHASEIA